MLLTASPKVYNASKHCLLEDTCISFAFYLNSDDIFSLNGSDRQRPGLLLFADTVS